MLKLTPLSNSDGTVVLKLEGKLLAAWIAELHRTITELGVADDAIHLDLSTLSFIDAAGARVLNELIENGAVVRAASGFVAALLKRGTP
jgi:anti-anti-sigma regulatory factor